MWSCCRCCFRTLSKVCSNLNFFLNAFKRHCASDCEELWSVTILQFTIHVPSFYVWRPLVRIVLSFCHFSYNIQRFYCYSYLLKIPVMVLTRCQYKNMRKEKLNQELNDINSSSVNDVNATLTDLRERFDEFTSKYDQVYSDLRQYKSFISHLLTRII